MFLNPIFLWAAAAALVPLVLHLLQRRRVVRVRFSTLRFLQLAHRRSANRLRMENFLLWLLRTLLVLALAAGFAMPMLRTRGFGGWLGGARRDVAIVLDRSYSLRYRTPHGAACDRAIEAATEIVRGLEDGDQVAVFLAEDIARPLVEMLNPDRDFVLNQIRALKPGYTTSQLQPALAAARDALQQEKRRREREIHIVTDGQALPWRDLARRPDGAAPAVADKPTAASAWDAATLGRNTTFFVTLLGPPAPENLCPADAQVEPALFMPDTAGRLRVRLAATGVARGGALSLLVDDRLVASRSLTPQETAGGEIVFPLPPMAAGTHAVRVETPPDALALDDAFHVLIRVREAVSVVCVGTPENVFYLSRALNPGGADSAIRVQAVPPGQPLPDPLGAADALFVCDALAWPGQTVARVDQYVRDGGLAVFFPGDRARLADFNAWACLQALRPAAIADIPAPRRRHVLRWTNPRHPVLAALPIDDANAPVVTLLRSLQWDKSLSPDRVLAVAGADAPFLLTQRHGKGQALLFAVSADRAWSSFPLSPFFLPFAHQIARVGAGAVGERPWVVAARSLPLAEQIRGIRPESVLYGPDDAPVVIRRSLADGVESLLAEDLFAPGIYRLDRAGAGREPALAVNVDRAESNLTRVDKARLPERLGSKQVIVSESVDDLLRQVREHRVGRTLGENLLWLALILAVAETLYANRKGRAGPALSESLDVQPSGRLTAVRPAEGASAATGWRAWALALTARLASRASRGEGAP